MRHLTHSLATGVALGLALVAYLHAAEPTSAPPNVVVILTDDQGYGDLSRHGNPSLKTPRLDRLFAEGAEFARFYAAPVCSPSRAALMTGWYPQRGGVHAVIPPWIQVDERAQALPEVLRAAGYRTAIYGKWHLRGLHLRRGFDEGLYSPHSLHNHHNPAFTVIPGVGEVDGYKPAEEGPMLRVAPPTSPAQGYAADVLTDRAIEFLRRRQTSGPFFLYLAYHSPHAPLQIPADSPHRFPDDDEKTAKVYAMLANLDGNVGRLLDELAALRLEENTIVVFVSDNGTAPESVDAASTRHVAGLRGLKGSVYEGGIRVPAAIRWPGRIPANRVVDQPAALIDIMPTLLDLCGLSPRLPHGFDGVSLVPLLSEQPAAWPERPLFNQFFTQAMLPPEGLPPKEFGYAVQQGRWKLVQARRPLPPETDTDERRELHRRYFRYEKPEDFEPRVELFDLAADPGETRDLAGEHPDTVARLQAAYDTWRAGLGRPPR